MRRRRRRRRRRRAAAVAVGVEAEVGVVRQRQHPPPHPPPHRHHHHHHHHQHSAQIQLQPPPPPTTATTPTTREHLSQSTAKRAARWRPKRAQSNTPSQIRPRSPVKSPLPSQTRRRRSGRPPSAPENCSAAPAENDSTKPSYTLCKVDTTPTPPRTPQLSPSGHQYLSDPHTPTHIHPLPPNHPPTHPYTHNNPN